MVWMKNLLAGALLTAFSVALLMHLLGEPVTMNSPAGEAARYQYLNAATKLKLLSVWGSPEQEPVRFNFATMAYSRDGKRALFESESSDQLDGKLQESVLSLWDVERGVVVRELKLPGVGTSALALSADGQRGLAATLAFIKDATKIDVILLDFGAGKTTTLSATTTDVLLAIAISPNGKHAATADDKGVRLWDLEQRKPLQVLNTAKPLSGLFYSADGKHLLVGDQPSGLRVFETDTGKEVAFLADQGGVNFATWASDGKRAGHVTGDLAVRIWDVASAKVLKTLPKPKEVNGVSALTLSADGKKAVLLTIGVNQIGKFEEEFSVYCLDVDSGKEDWKTALNLKGRAPLAFTPDGKQVLLGGGANPFLLLDVADGKIAKAWGGHKGAITALAVDANDNVWSASVDRAIKLWDTKGQDLKTLLGHKEAVTALALAGGRLVSGSSDKTLKVWDAKSGKELHTLAGHTGNVTSLAATPDGKRVVSGSGDRTVKIWEVESGKELHTLVGHAESVNAVAVSPDGKWIAAAGDDNRIMLWPNEPKADVEPTEFAGHDRQVTSLVFTGDGKHLIAGSQDQTATLWDVVAAKKLKTFAGHKNWVQAVAVQGDLLFSASDDLTVRLWSVQTGTEIESLDLGRARDLARCFGFQRSPRCLVVGTAAGMILRFELK